MTNRFFRKVLSCCTFTLNVSPVVLLSSILLWAFWAYHRMCVYLIENQAILQGCFYMIFFEPLFVLVAWSFYKASRTSPGTTKDIAKQSREELDIEQGYQDQNSEYVQLLQQDHHLQGNNCARQIDDMDDDDDDDNHDNNGQGTSSGPAILSLDNNNKNNNSNNTPSFLAVSSSFSITVKRDGGKRYCQKCKLEKCDRSHHCRSCKRCILKMDHHCPWINNCVGFYNYKFFYLFIVYGALFCIYVFSTTLPPTIHIMKQPMGVFEIDFNWLFLCFVSVVFGLFLTPFSLFHTRQLCKNRTTIEFYEKANYRLGSRQKRMGSRRQIIDIMRSRYFNPWELGTRTNVEQVLGKSLLTWFLPIGLPSGNGYNFPLNAYAYDTLDIDETEDV